MGMYDLITEGTTHFDTGLLRIKLYLTLKLLPKDYLYKFQERKTINGPILLENLWGTAMASSSKHP